MMLPCSELLYTAPARFATFALDGERKKEDALSLGPASPLCELPARLVRPRKSDISRRLHPQTTDHSLRIRMDHLTTNLS